MKSTTRLYLVMRLIMYDTVPHSFYTPRVFGTDVFYAHYPLALELDAQYAVQETRIQMRTPKCRP